MKKIFLTLLLLLGLISYAQKPIYIQNFTSAPADIYIEATGSQLPGCNTRVTTILTLASGASISLNTFTNAPSNMWQLNNGTTYTNAQAAGIYGLAQWELVRYSPLKCACGAFVTDNNVCYSTAGGNGYYNYVPCSGCTGCNNMACDTYASWVDMGSYISVVFHN